MPKFLTNYYKLKLSKYFRMLGLNFRPTTTTSRIEEHNSLNTLRKIMFIILYQYYLLKILELKKSIVEVKI